ncbi:MAG: PolC-type DNA polymerase III [Lachnospiraceae bacterium]|nr:PolC-type DNA polymerase III [Lachnospiraceae bacterium]
MARIFTEVFPALTLEKSLSDLFSQATVDKVKTNTPEDNFRIYITSGRLIPKALIYKVEAEIKGQLFRGKQVTIRIFEKFNLSAQYNAEKLMQVYRESIYLELNARPVLLNILRNTKISYPDENQIMLAIDNSLYLKNKVAELIDYFDEVFNERCGLNVEIKLKFAYQENKNTSRNDDAKIRAKINEATIIARGEIIKKENAVPESIRVLPKDSAPPRKTRSRRSDNPDVFYGRDFDDGEITPLLDIVDGIGEVIIRGKIIALNFRAIKNEKTIVIFNLTDFTDTIKVKIFIGDELLDDLKEKIKKDAFIKIKGLVMTDKFDGDLTIGSIVGIKKTVNFTILRQDEAKIKRVELHCHTKMSDMDGVSEVGELIERAYQWGHRAIAITDHGVVQAFPEAYKAWKKIYQKEKERCHEEEGKAPPTKADFFKVIYGVEAYLVDDLREIATNAKDQLLDGEFVVFDLETTGFSPIKDRIIEIGAVLLSNGVITERYQTFINPNIPIPYEVERLTGLTDEMVLDAPKMQKALPEFLAFVGERPLIAHNADFDMGFIKENCRLNGMEREFTYLDTLALARVFLPGQKTHKLDTVCKALNISQKSHHRALDDAECTAQIFGEFCLRLKEKGIKRLEEVNTLNLKTAEMVKKLPSHHAIILAADEKGRENLYTLISESHLNFYSRRPRIPKSLLIKHREGLILGSACEAGELYRAVLEGKSAQELGRIVKFYDYLEIQPTMNNKFMLKSEKISAVSSPEDIHELNRKVIKLGEDYNKPVVATSDVHFTDPDDEVYRRIIMAGQGFDDADDQAPLYLRTTDEMLDEFAYLGREKAFEVVVSNTNKIADMISPISPLRPEKCPPVIENSDIELKEICFSRAISLYGNPLPELVKNRLDKELNSIISNGFAVMYIIAQKLVWKSLEDGYLVGSRGSVGSSFVATMAGITEVNPLKPHYYCLKCFYSDFDSEKVREYAGRTGFDLPDSACPKCGEMLKKDGFDIPFETFLGFNGDKEPDIDLNFSGEYQSKAHKYTEVIFGEGQTFRAGTISTLADKTAFGYVKKYYDERGIIKRNCEIDRIVMGCTGIRKSTGQHPGGIIILPLGERINTFTPVQRPANDVNSDIITTHFDYHSIDHNLLKLDILGHDDPTMVKMLQDLTGVDPLSIPFQDDKVMSLFQNTKALNLTPEQIGGCRLGAMGVPEFGTDFVIQMLEDTKPQSFFDLICISGLSHGTDVWLGNAKDLISEGKATISTVISTRDDIMTYLINKGVDSSLSFNITESVRRGKGLKEEWKKAMIKANVPDWYIWSCEKIKYMFPKAHAAAYVMMAWRIAYFKVYYPLAYYAAFFSIRASAFDYEIMCQGKKHLEQAMKEYRGRELAGKLTKKEQDTLRDMRIVGEMYERGFEFVPLDIYRANAHKFQLVNDKIMPSLLSIDGLGDKAAEAVVEAREAGKFLSRDDFRLRAKVSKTVTALMERLGLFGELPESNQISLFDYSFENN